MHQTIKDLILPRLLQWGWMLINEKYLKEEEGDLGIYKGRFVVESFANLMEVMKKDGNRCYLRIGENSVISRFQSTKSVGAFLNCCCFPGACSSGKAQHCQLVCGVIWMKDTFKYWLLEFCSHLSWWCGDINKPDV